MDERILSVTQLNEYVKGLVESDRFLSNVAVRGELSNYKVYPSGHHYFSIKDEESAIRCVMFRGSASGLRFRPESGMKVICTGRVAVYTRDGAYQLYASTLTPDDKEHKKPIPRYPMRVGVVTSSAGAAVHDIIRVLRKRWPVAKILLLPVRVQGVEAPPEIAGAIRYADRHNIADVLIVGRGGGSMEDLWCFNDERVARAIYDCGTPVISAVGHEPDVTISDFVADLRAATPSNGAELCAPDISELIEYLDSAGMRSFAAVANELASMKSRLKSLEEKRVLQDPKNLVEDRRLRIDHLKTRLAAAASAMLHGERRKYAEFAGKLDALSPLKVLGRGYAIARREDGRVIREKSDVRSGDEISLKLRDDTIECIVK